MQFSCVGGLLRRRLSDGSHQHLDTTMWAGNLKMKKILWKWGREGETPCGVHQWLPSFSLHVIVVAFPLPSSSPQLWPPSSYSHPAPSHHLLFPYPNPLLDLAATSQVLILVIGLLMAVQRSNKVHAHGRVLCASPRHQELLEMILTPTSRRRMPYTLIRTENIELGTAT